MGIGIGSVVSMGLSVLPKLAAPIATAAKSVGLNNVSSFVTAGASALSGGQSAGGSKDNMKAMNMKHIFDQLQKMRDESQAEYKKALEKTAPTGG